MIPLGIFKQIKSENLALNSKGGTIWSSIAPDYGVGLSSILIGNRQVNENSGSFAAWDLSVHTENLQIDIALSEPAMVDKIVCAWGLNDDNTIAGSEVYDTTGIYFPKDGALLELSTWNNITGDTDVSTSVSSRLQEYSFTPRVVSSLKMRVSKDIVFGLLYIVGIEIWGTKI